MHSTEKESIRWALRYENIPTSLHNINFSDVLELPDGDIQRAESARPANASTAVDHYGRAQLVAGPGRDQLSDHLSLFLSDTLKHTTCNTGLRAGQEMQKSP